MEEKSLTVIRLDGQDAGGSRQVVGVVDQGSGTLRSTTHTRVGKGCSDLKPAVCVQRLPAALMSALEGGAQMHGIAHAAVRSRALQRGEQARRLQDLQADNSRSPAV